jgi:hypothetical protein
MNRVMMDADLVDPPVHTAMEHLEKDDEADEEQLADSESTIPSAPSQFRTIHCPLIHVTPFPAAASSSSSATPVLSGAQAGCLIIGIVQHLIVQLQLTAWSVVGSRNLRAAVHRHSRCTLTPFCCAGMIQLVE